ncbi:hypothetical protein SUGI_0917290 [Cryptomeria japonica]|nr:hypothetical protein SUGI_0917290 [Cryptomeria japonica]
MLPFLLNIRKLSRFTKLRNYFDFTLPTDFTSYYLGKTQNNYENIAYRIGFLAYFSGYMRQKHVMTISRAAEFGGKIIVPLFLY